VVGEKFKVRFVGTLVHVVQFLNLREVLLVHCHLNADRHILDNANSTGTT
jgi:hypothetical protein